jgi:hypothetical protein
MSEHAPDEATSPVADQRFVDFVVEHAEQAMRWEVMDQRPSVPFSRVEFDVEAVNGDQEYLNFPPLGRFVMRAYIKLPLDKRQPGRRVAPVIVESAYGQLSLVDESEELSAVVGGDDPHADKIASVERLLYQLEALEATDKLVAAGQREYML